jgi:hypothetical protein
VLLIAGPNDDIHGSSVAGALQCAAAAGGSARGVCQGGLPGGSARGVCQRASRDTRPSTLPFQASCAPQCSSMRCRRAGAAARKVSTLTREPGIYFGWLIFQCFR